MFPEYPNMRKENAFVCGKIKLQCCGLCEVVSLGSKCYSQIDEAQAEQLKHRGIDATAGRMLTHKLYKDVVLNSHKVVSVKTKQIRSVDHTLYCISLNEVALRNLDLYRCYYDPNDVNKSFPFGHYKLSRVFKVVEKEKGENTTDCSIVDNNAQEVVFLGDSQSPPLARLLM